MLYKILHTVATRLANINPKPHLVKFIKLKTILSSNQRKNLKCSHMQLQPAILLLWHYFQPVIQLWSMVRKWSCSPSTSLRFPALTQSAATQTADLTFSTTRRQLWCWCWRKLPLYRDQTPCWFPDLLHPSSSLLDTSTAAYQRSHSATGYSWC